jgi:phosphoribosylamine--glycine ligase/phosphoribosylaminoimidazole synthetase
MSGQRGLRVLVVGSGGREHAMAWAASRSPLVDRVLVTPGNGGWPRDDRWPLAADDVSGIVDRCRNEDVDLVLVGPEVALAAGLVDALTAAGIKAFGPTKAAAELEWSKSACRTFAERHHIPSPRHATFAGAAAAAEHARTCGYAVVVKQSGLASGKGVVVPDGMDETLAAIAALGVDGGELVLEERLSGEEVSLLAFSDGRTVVPMPPAQDHKREGEGDRGRNTGGMGALAPAPVCPPALVQQLTREILQPAVDGLAAEGRPYVGVLYAGLMLTADGPRLLEFNCRFGDPEAQVLIPLLDGDLVEIALACVEGRLADTKVGWHPASACTVVVAAAGYPGTPRTGMTITLPDEGMVFHAGSDERDGVHVVTGGRVLACTGIATDLARAREDAYVTAAAVAFDGAWMRRDIGWRAIARTAAAGGYKASGVDIDAGEHAVEMITAAVQRTHTPAVLAGVGSFGGAFDASALKQLDAPVLVASTDGVGTKLSLAAQAGRLRGCGADIVNHCVDDVLVQRAEPLFFLDYVASGKLDPREVAELVEGMSEACVENGCVLLGGETAEMPGVYVEGHLDLAGTLVGVAERSRLLPRGDVAVGDVLVAVRSVSPHTNGYSLLRRVFSALPLDAQPAPLERPLIDELLEPHRSYLPLLRPLLATDLVKALAHITGGGLPGNLPRVLPEGVSAQVQLGSWPVPPLFRLVAELTGLDAHELHRTLNMGVGMVVVCAPGDVARVQSMIAEDTWVIGRLVAGDRTVELL